jgi:hypothetical protein
MALITPALRTPSEPPAACVLLLRVRPGAVARNTRLGVLAARKEFHGRASNPEAAVRLGVHGGQRRSPGNKEARHAAVSDLVQ